MRQFLQIVLCCFIWFSAFAQAENEPGIIVLGVAQDGGYPHMGCTKKCCTMAWENPKMRRNVVSLALIPPTGKRWWLFEATPDIKEQLQYFRELTGGKFNYLPEGIFITHAHIGHYTGLMQLGKEVMNTKEVKVYVLPKMKKYLETNGPWSQLATQKNIQIESIDPDRDTKSLLNQKMKLWEISDNVSVSPFTVPHRDEFSETAGFLITISGKRYIFIPDINKWAKWEMDIRDLVASSDVALLDGTFYEDGEIPGRNMSEIPHPFVAETMNLFATNKDGSPAADSLRNKIHFIHFNHTNPLMWDKEKQRQVKKAGFNIAEQGQKL